MGSSEVASTKQSTKECIKKTFMELYKNKPLNEVKVSDLIKACKISRGTFYFHFADVYALYHECERELIRFLENDLLDVDISAVGGDFKKHVKMLSRFLGKYVDHQEKLQCFLNGSEGGTFRQAWLDSICQHYAISMEYTDEASLAQRDNLILFFAGGYREILSAWILSGCKEPVENIAQVTTQVEYRGVFPQAPFKNGR